MTSEKITIDPGNKSVLKIIPVGPGIHTLVSIRFHDFWGSNEYRYDETFKEFRLYNGELNFQAAANAGGHNQVVVRQRGIGDDEDDTVRLAIFSIDFPTFRSAYNGRLEFGALLTDVQMYDPREPLPWDGVVPEPNAEKYKGPHGYPYSPPVAEIKSLKLPWPVTISSYTKSDWVFDEDEEN